MKQTIADGSNDLFKQYSEQIIKKNAPLADRMRPRTLDEYIGQLHILGPGRLLRRAIQIDQLSSLIFYGPPGTGKTTLARIIANTTRAEFLSINAVLAGVKDIREAIQKASETVSLYGRRTILFIDEVHRFNKAQQDALLPHVENGVLILIGATTENPYFEVNKALVSRSRIFQLYSLSTDDLKAVALQALNDTQRGYGNKSVILEEDALEHLVQVASGDARGVLNALELAVETTTPLDDGTLLISRATIEDSIQKRAVLYDKDGDAHYDTISAFIKALRGSDPDAALYWMAKMLYAGEDPRFIFRRMLILAGEDIGMADPQAIGVVTDAARAFDFVGLPEGRYHLAHACLYCATAPKSNSSMGFFDAISTVSKENEDEVPNHLKDASRDSEGFGHGAGYLYPHAYRDHWVAQQYLPDTLQGKVFYQPSNQGFEKMIRERITGLREAQIEAMLDQNDYSPLSCINGITSYVESQQWMNRSFGNRGASLGIIRNQILHHAKINSTDLVLDLNVRTGLLSFAAARIAREGAVWALAHSEQSYETARTIARQMKSFSSPVIIKTDLAQFVEVLQKEAGRSVLFDTIIGRAVVIHNEDKKALLERCVHLCKADGKIVLAEPIPSAGQRISALVNPGQVSEECMKLLIDCEQELFHDPSDPMVNWGVDDLRNEIRKVTGVSSTFSLFESDEKRFLRPEDIDFWFRSTSGEKRYSLGDRLKRQGGVEMAKRVACYLHTSLDFKQISWKTTSLLIVCTLKKGSTGRKGGSN